MKDTKLLNAEIPAEVHKKLRLKSVEDDQTIRSIVENALRQYMDEGGKQKQKYQDQIVEVCARLTDAMQFAVISISHLERIPKGDPDRKKAFEKVEKWLADNKPKG